MISLKQRPTSGNAVGRCRCDVRLCPVNSGSHRLAVPNTCRTSLGAVAQGFLDAAAGGLVLPLDALDVDTQQNLDAVASPLGDLGGWYASVEPSGDASVP